MQEHVPDLAVGGDSHALGLVEDEAHRVDEKERDRYRAYVVVGEEDSFDVAPLCRVRAVLVLVFRSAQQLTREGIRPA